MTMLESGAAEVASGAESGASTVGKKFGLTGSQKAAAVSGGIPSPRTKHPYILGLLLISGGCLMLIGSITGTLPSMIAALFDPNALDDSGGNPASPGIGSDIVNSALNALIPGRAL
jgi:hypothetical protein